MAKQVGAHVNWLRLKYPDTRPESFHHHMLVNDPFYPPYYRKSQIA